MERTPMTQGQQARWIGRFEDLAAEHAAHLFGGDWGHSAAPLERHLARVGLERDASDDTERVFDYLVTRRHNSDGAVTWLDDLPNGAALWSLLLHTLLNDGPDAACHLAATYDRREDEEE